MLPNGKIYKHYDYFIAYEREDNLLQLGELRPLDSFADKRGCLKAYAQLIQDMRECSKTGWVAAVSKENGPMLNLMWRAGAWPYTIIDNQILFYKREK